MYMRACVYALTAGILTIFTGSLSAKAPKDDWAKTSRSFQAAVAAGRDGDVEQAALLVAGDNSVRAVELLLKPVRQVAPGLYWAIISAFSRITDAKALDAVVVEIIKGKALDTRRDLLMALRLCESTAVVEPLMRILKEGSPDLKVSALEELVDRGCVTAIPTFVDLAAGDADGSSELTRRLRKGIRNLVMEDPPGSPAQWKEWWAKRGDSVKAEPEAGILRRKVGETVVDTVRRSRSTDYEELKQGKKEEIVVVDGEYDKVQDVLFRLGVNYTALSGDRFVGSDDLGIGKPIAIFVNCGVADLTGKRAARLRQYVAEGGYVFATDLAIISVINQAFPGYLQVGKGGVPDMTVDILPWKGSSGHPLLRGVDLPVSAVQKEAPRLRWIIDAGGPALAYDPLKVIPLVEAPELLKRRRPSAVAVEFSHGGEPKLTSESVNFGGVFQELERMKGGKVVCVLSHFSKQRSNDDGFALQNLLLNFLIEARDRLKMREAGKPDGKR